MPLTYTRRANAHILYEPTHFCGISEHSSGLDTLERLFSAPFWEERDAIVARAPGRGESLFISPEALSASQKEEWVLRPYRRGGLIAKLSTKRYLWTGVEHTRAFQEMRLTTSLGKQGLAVPTMLGACVWKHGLTYEASLLSVRIPGAKALAGLLEHADKTLLHRVGVLIRHAHELGLDHVDLNARNLLIDEQEKPWIIDLDHCRLRPSGKWKEANLSRLERSLEKFVPGKGQQLLESIREGYTEG